ncbi:MAG: sugar phosphate isomerase/epimerase [Clostridiales bacterium]|nr:sugar phosphate isomerase/epimerase [Clostridiales bacterium]
MGYDGVELAGLYGHSPEKIRDILKEIGLTPISAHVPYHELVEDLEGTVSQYATIGCRYITIPYLTEDYRYGTKNFEEMMGNIPGIAKECAKHGITLLYHNHDFEFEKMEDGTYVLDYMYQNTTNEELQTEMDTCWIGVAGEDPIEYIRKYAGRSPLLHLKDYTNNPFHFQPLGKGIQDIPNLLKEAVNIGCKWVIVEQDGHPDRAPMEDMKISRDYLKTLEW